MPPWAEHVWGENHVQDNLLASCLRAWWSHPSPEVRRNIYMSAGFNYSTDLKYSMPLPHKQIFAQVINLNLENAAGQT